MSKYTCELRTIIDNGFEIFDFEYQRTPESIAILSDEELKHGFINHFYFREVGFETLERFKFKLKTQWLESLGEFDALLVAYHDKINIKANMSQNTDNINILDETPKSAIDFNSQMTKATTINRNKQKYSGATGITEIELLEIYHDKIKDIQTEFYNSFDNLFMQIF